MSKHNVKLDSLLYVFKNLETAISSELEEIYNEKKRREYRDDIIRLSSIDVSLLTSYYMNSNDEAQRQFSKLLYATYQDNEALETFLSEFKNLYFLHKSELVSTTQYGSAKRGVLDFINKLKDEALTEKKLDSTKEKTLLDKKYIIRKLIKYFNATPGSIEIKNIDNFIMMLDMFDISHGAKNNALYVAIENNNKFYNKNIKKNNKDNE